MHPLTLISAYFMLNLIVTTSNRSIIVRTSAPYLLTALHATITYVCTTYLTYRQPCSSSKHNSFTKRQWLYLTLFSSFYAMNIAISNLSIGLINLSLHQTIRATAPALTIIVSVACRLTQYSTYSDSTYLSLVPIVFGVSIATYADRFEATFLGVFVTFVGAVLAVLKTIITQQIQLRLQVSGTRLVQMITPLAGVQSVGLASYTGEVADIYLLQQIPERLGNLMLLVAGNALLAAALNLSSFEATRRCGPLSMAVAANLKQIAILALEATSLEEIHWHTIVGTVMTVIGGIWYVYAQQQVGRCNSEKEKDVNGIENDVVNV